MANQFNLNNFDSFLESVNKIVSQTEPELDVEKKNCYTYLFGETAYDEMVENEINDKSDVMINALNETISKEKQKIISQIDIYNGLYINFKNILDLLEQYKSQNINLFDNLKNDTHDVLTNERKTYYKDQENDVLNKIYYYIFCIIYIIVVICFIVFSLIYPSQSSITVRILLFIFFIGLPFISTWILGTIIYIMYWLFGLLPKNVYNSSIMYHNI
jgi:hypothetical protein